MSIITITLALRKFIEQRAKHRCEYCQTQQIVIGMPLEVEHIFPQAQGGLTNEENLCLACPRCNRYKGTQVVATDEDTGMLVQLFNPRVGRWSEHFMWQQDGLYIVGLTDVGRVTINALQMNNPVVVRSRRIWVDAGWHPPIDS